MTGGRIDATTIAGPDALELVEVEGSTASGVVLFGSEGRVICICRGRGVMIGPLGAADFRQLGQQILDAADERAEAEAAIASSMN